MPAVIRLKQWVPLFSKHTIKRVFKELVSRAPVEPSLHQGKPILSKHLTEKSKVMMEKQFVVVYIMTKHPEMKRKSLAFILAF